MKKLYIILFTLFSLYSYCQNKNFAVENNLIIWKLVYQDSTNISELKKNPRLEFNSDSTGYIKKTNFNDDNLREMVGEFLIESKKGKYRVSVFNIKFFVEPIGLSSGGLSMQSISEYTIEKSLLKKNGAIRETSLGYNLTETLNPHLTVHYK
ncbi:hypothetical protein ASF10_23790 [Flavobacterium sp. Leaf82]|nr:hypothetical protein ASF10_23790 [Flavobacterium sp. Leaf82]